MSNDEDRLPGITFNFKSSSLAKPEGVKEKFRVHLHLDAIVSNEELWRVIEQRFKDGYHIYTQKDFHEDVIDVMRKKAKDHSARIEQLEKDLEKERAARTKAEREVEKYKTPLESFGVALQGKTP